MDRGHRPSGGRGGNSLAPFHLAAKAGEIAAAKPKGALDLGDKRLQYRAACRSDNPTAPPRLTKPGRQKKTPLCSRRIWAKFVTVVVAGSVTRGISSQSLVHTDVTIDEYLGKGQA